MIAALLAIAVPLLEQPDAVQMHGGVRAYFESAYQSSSGRIRYTKPVAEQYGFLNIGHDDYGTLSTDFWLGSALNGQADSSHRRAFYCYEGTVTYGNYIRVAEEAKLSAWGGIIWDWLGGYKTDPGTPTGWITETRLSNPYITPYLNALGFFNCRSWKRIRFGMNHVFKVVDSVTLTPFAEATWGDPERFRLNFGGETSGHLLGGALMFSSVGMIAEWAFYENFYLWGRYKQYILLDHEARSLVRASNDQTAKTTLPIFGLGAGFRF